MTTTPAEDTGRLAAQLANRLNLLPLYAVRTAVTLDLAEALDEPLPVDELAARTGCDDLALRVLIDYLAGLNLMERRGDGTVALTDQGRLLHKEHPSGISTFWDMRKPAYRLEQSYALLPDVIRSGHPAFPDLFGRSVYRDTEEDPTRVADAVRLAHSLVDTSATQLAQWLDLPADAIVADLGSGSGVHLIRLLSANPKIRAIAMDLPVTLGHSRHLFAEHGFEDRVSLLAGDFFVDPLPRADAYLLSNIVMDNTDDDAERLLRRIKDHAPQGARVLVLELASELTPPSLSNHMTLHQLCVTGGRLRTLDELMSLGQAAGLAYDQARHLGSGVTVVVFTIASGGAADQSAR